MRKNISVFALAARASFYKILLILVLMIAAEIIVFHFALSQSADLGTLEETIDHSRILWIFGITTGVIYFLLERFSQNIQGSVPGYTINRLLVSEKRFAVICSIYNVCCFILLFMIQILTAYLLCLFYVEQNTENPYSPAIFLAFNRNEFLHSLLPMGSLFGLIKNAVIVMGLGCCCACASLMQRHGHNYTLAILMPTCAVAAFAKGYAEAGFSIVFIFAIAGLATSSFFMVKGVTTDET